MQPTSKPSAIRGFDSGITSTSSATGTTRPTIPSFRTRTASPSTPSTEAAAVRATPPRLVGPPAPSVAQDLAANRLVKTY
ncbi:MAG: hypothetical protein ACLP0J_24400 [Solirubrobacteraceae bacterium]